VIRLARTGAEATSRVTHGSADAVQALRQEFDANHCAVIPGLFDPELLAWVQKEMDQAAFDARDYDGLAGELTLDQAVPLVARLLFLLNDPDIHAAVEQVTGIGPIARFDGRIYRRLPVAEHYDNWHDDLGGPHRMVTMSVNLGGEPYGGGELLLRRKGTDEPLARVHNTGPGDALLFRIDPGLEHRVTSVTAGSKTALAGWFASTPPWPLPAPDE
jgi:2OG-Fe(II) oxygenase superfamily